ncbi:hypothetical protein [Endozoicomonas sp. YOMI1]|uniref:hypothetical protein n=1 Tax=Endozoicomonas sp. YOMI1 TaxID=2828739 RepID=UPI002148D415|nr:hypothetical protein [Endozoicomonas sp. YOMI1]
MGNSCPRLPEKTEPGSRNQQREAARVDNILNSQPANNKTPPATDSAARGALTVGGDIKTPPPHMTGSND